MQYNIINPEKEKTWEEIYKVTLINKNAVDNKKRPTYSVHQEFNGYIRENGKFVEYHDVTKYITKLKEMFGEKEITVGWKNSRDKVEPKFVGNIEEFKETANYESEKANVRKFKEAHKAIQYVDRVPTNATFVKNVFEVNVDFKLGDKRTDYHYPREDDDANQPEKTYLAYRFGYKDAEYSHEDTRYQYGLGQLYKEYEKDGVRYRIATPTKYEQHASVSAPIYSEIHYYNLYQPTRAYHISNQLTNVKNIYAKEETETTESKGSVIVKYQLADGTSIKESADVVKDAVISSTETKYYLNKDNQKVVVGTPTTTNNDASYDTTTLKLQEITKDGKKYKLVGLKTGSPTEKGTVVSGTTEITYVYKLTSGGNVFAKYMLEGTTTEIASGKLLTKDASIGDEYTSVAPKVGTLLQKDGKTYFYKGHRATSAPETGMVEESEKTVIYDFVEYFSEKGKPEVQPELPEGVVSEKGEPAIHSVAPLLITRHIIIGSNEELVPTEVGHFGPKQGIITKNGKQYQYEMTREEDGITTHYYRELSGETRSNIPQENREKQPEQTQNSTSNPVEPQQENLQHNAELVSHPELPKTGQAETLPTWLGFLSLIGGVFVKRKNNKDNF